MDWLRIFQDTFKDSFSIILKMIYIMIPIFIIIECIKDAGLMGKIAERLKWLSKLFKLPGEAAIGIIVGAFAGLLLGSGVIIQLTEEIKMSKTQINTLFIVVGIFHSVIEETLVFTSIGVNGFLILFIRMSMALIFSFVYIGITSNLPNKVKNKNEAA